MLSKINAPEHHQFNRYEIQNDIDGEKLSFTLLFNQIEDVFHPILKASLCIDPTKRERFDEILERLVDAYIVVANIP